ncbi:MAG: hypothetical protein ACK4M5_00930, partial [Dietzia cercidiphylli]
MLELRFALLVGGQQRPVRAPHDQTDARGRGSLSVRAGCGRTVDRRTVGPVEPDPGGSPRLVHGGDERAASEGSGQTVVRRGLEPDDLHDPPHGQRRGGAWHRHAR